MIVVILFKCCCMSDLKNSGPIYSLNCQKKNEFDGLNFQKD